MKDVNINHRGAETQRVRREKQLFLASLRRLCISVSLRWIFLFAVFAGAALAREAAPLAPDEATEKRLIAISSELRCLVCQNESLAGSNAELAYDLRREIRALIREGKSDNEIMDFMVGRYGDFVRYRPPLKGITLALWFGPGLLFVGGLTTLVLYLRRRNKAINDAPLSDGEQREADRLLKLERPQQ
jgi:cytochrome c-type biogenesis protein CcmH